MSVTAQLRRRKLEVPAEFAKAKDLLKSLADKDSLIQVLEEDDDDEQQQQQQQQEILYDAVFDSEEEAILHHENECTGT